MGIGRFEFEFLLHEHKYRPVAGEVLTLGKQAIALNPEQVRDLLRSQGAPQHIALWVEER